MRRSHDVRLTALTVLFLAATSLFAPVLAQAPAEVAEGRREFLEHRCILCHGPTAAGDGPLHTSVIPPPANLTLVRDAPAMIASIVRNGIQGTAMPPNRVSDEELRELLAFVGAQPLDTFHQWAYPWSLRQAPPPVTMAPALFLTTCAGCHGASGSGRTAYAMNDPHFWPKPADFRARNSDPGRSYYTITFGRRGTMMPPQLGKLTEQARWALARYVSALFDPRSTATIPTGHMQFYKNPFRPGSAAVTRLGEENYQLYCVGCHGERANGSFLAPRQTDRAWLYGGGTDNAAFMVETKGIPGKLMPAFVQLTEASRWAVITYYRSRGGLPDPLAGKGRLTRR